MNKFIRRLSHNLQKEKQYRQYLNISLEIWAEISVIYCLNGWPRNSCANKLVCSEVNKFEVGFFIAWKANTNDIPLVFLWKEIFYCQKIVCFKQDKNRRILELKINREGLVSIKNLSIHFYSLPLNWIFNLII